VKVAALRPSELDAAVRPMEYELVQCFQLAEASAQRLLDRASREGWAAERLTDEMGALLGRPVENSQ
jgi:hypothetical protein